MTATQTQTPQDLQLEMMRLASFNDFDGPAVVDSLLAHRDLWRGAIFDRAAYFTLGTHRYRDEHEGTTTSVEPIDFIRLRDIGEGYWNADTLYLLPSGKDDSALEALALRWLADEVDWIDGYDAGPKVLRVWWD